MNWLIAWWWRLCHYPWKMACYEMVDGVCVGEPEPAHNGGVWVRPLWRLDRFYLFSIRMPLWLASEFGYEDKWHF